MMTLARFLAALILAALILALAVALMADGFGAWAHG
jgi:hypothetical protein